MRRGASLSSSGNGVGEQRRYGEDLEVGGEYDPISYGSDAGTSTGSPLFRHPPGVSSPAPYLRTSGTSGTSTSYGNNESSLDSPGLDSKVTSIGMDRGNDGYDSKQKTGRRRHHGGGGLLQQLQLHLLQRSRNGASIHDSLFHHTNLQIATGAGYGFLFLLSFVLSIHTFILLLVLYTCVLGIGVSYVLAMQVLSVDDGTPEMRAVSDPIRQGAAGFLHVQYTAIAQFAVPLAALIFISYQFRPTSHNGRIEGIAVLGNVVLGITASLGFAIGAICSAGAGYLSMWVAAQSNIRVASASRRSFDEALVVCFRGGAFSAVLNLTFCIAGVTLLYVVLDTIFVSSNDIDGSLKSTEIPMLMVGYGFGSSFVALFMQLGGGIYTKAADVGADLVGKVEQSIPEDDPRNPAVIADLVGDMVGDCVGSSADVFESVAAEIIGAMILGSTLAKESGMPSAMASKFVLFPLIVHAMDIVVSSVGIAVVGYSKKHVLTSGGDDPMKFLQKGYKVALCLSVGGFFLITRWLLYVPENPWASWNFFGCGLVGMLCAYIIVQSTTYFTDYKYRPVQSIAEASTTGHGTNIIVGVAVGMKATVFPTLSVAVAVLMAYHLGASTGIGASPETGEYSRNAGLFGTAVATMGMLSNAVYILSMNNFGPIAGRYMLQVVLNVLYLHVFLSAYTVATQTHR